MLKKYLSEKVIGPYFKGKVFRSNDQTYQIKPPEDVEDILQEQLTMLLWGMGHQQKGIMHSHPFVPWLFAPFPKWFSVACASNAFLELTFFCMKDFMEEDLKSLNYNALYSMLQANTANNHHGIANYYNVEHIGFPEDSHDSNQQSQGSHGSDQHSHNSVDLPHGQKHHWLFGIMWDIVMGKNWNEQRQVIVLNVFFHLCARDLKPHEILDSTRFFVCATHDFQNRFYFTCRKHMTSNQFDKVCCVGSMMVKAMYLCTSNQYDHLEKSYFFHPAQCYKEERVKSNMCLLILTVHCFHEATRAFQKSVQIFMQ